MFSHLGDAWVGAVVCVLRRLGDSLSLAACVGKTVRTNMGVFAHGTTDEPSHISRSFGFSYDICWIDRQDGMQQRP